MKEKLTGALGFFGFVLYYIFLAALSFMPLIILNWNIWLSLVLVIIMLTVPILDEIVLLVTYVWAFIIAVGNPINVITIVFFVFAAFYIFLRFIPMVLSLFQPKDR